MNTQNPHYLSDEDFNAIYSKVPRLNIDLIIRSSEGVLMALRTIEPHIGDWHLPGGTVYKGELIAEAAVRIAQKETGLTTTFVKDLGYMEFPHEKRGSIEVHTISIAVEVLVTGGELRHDENAKELRYFKEMPHNIIPAHGEFVVSHGLSMGN